LARRHRDLQRLLEDLRASRPAIDALVDVARVVRAAASFGAIWAALKQFLALWLLQPGDGPRVQVLLDERLTPLAAVEAIGALTGDDALAVIEESILTTRVPFGRLGEPAVYVGTIAGAVGLRFAAVRVIGLAEGHVPSVPREAPIL